MKRKFIDIKGYDYSSINEFKKDVEKKANGGYILISNEPIENLEGRKIRTISNIGMFEAFQPVYYDDNDSWIKVTAYFAKSDQL